MKTLAALVLVTATNWFSSIFPVTTALSQMTDIRSSVPLVPSGIRVKLSFPTAFWAVLKVQWALPVTWRSPQDSKELRKSGVVGSGLRGGEVTKAAALAQFLLQ